MTQQEQIKYMLEQTESNAEIIGQLRQELDRLRGDIVLQGQTQTDIELNALEQSAVLAEIKGMLILSDKDGDLNV